MKKDELTALAQNIYEEAFYANAYYNVIQQYQENRSKHLDEMNCSPAFYGIVYLALTEALFMNLAKIYESGKNTLNINTLLSEGKIYFSEQKEKPLIHHLQPEDECFFQEEVKKQKEFCARLQTPYRGTCVELNLEKYFAFFNMKLHSLNKLIKNLREQRNKIYAHNDADNVFHNDIWQRHPLYYKDIKKLIDFALELSRFCVAGLTDVWKPDAYVNVTDWSNTLKLVSIGEKYKDVYIQSLLNEEL